MGMYTEFIFGCELSKDTPRECIEALDYIINGEEKKSKYNDPQDWEETEFNERYIERTLTNEEINAFMEKYDFWRLFKCSSYYFGAANPIGKFYYDPIDSSYHISTRADLKNYEGQIEKFIEYIRPFVTQGSGYDHHIFAYVHYEEDEFPTLYGLDGEYHVLDPSLEAELRQREDKRWTIINKFAHELAPEFEITQEMLDSINVSEEEVTDDQATTFLLEYVINKYKNNVR